MNDLCVWSISNGSRNGWSMCVNDLCVWSISNGSRNGWSMCVNGFLCLEY